MKFRLFFLLLMFSEMAYTNELWDKVKQGASDMTDKSTEAISKTTSQVKENLSKNEDRKLRENRSLALNFNFSPVNVPFPMAWGANAYYIVNGNWMIGVDYLNSSKALGLFSIQFGEVKEKIYAVQARRFFGNSFNVKFGVGQRSTEVNFARDLFDLVSNDYSETASEFKTKFIRLGIGNQWHFKNRYTLSIDWISLDIPFSGEVVTSASRFADTQEDKEDIEDAEKLLKFYPSGGALKFDIGLVF